MQVGGWQVAELHSHMHPQNISHPRYDAFQFIGITINKSYTIVFFNIGMRKIHSYALHAFKPTIWKIISSLYRMHFASKICQIKTTVYDVQCSVSEMISVLLINGKSF